MATLIERAIGAARLDAATYEEVEADPTALGQAMAVVVAASVAAGIGAGNPGLGMLGAVVFNLIAWYAWAFVTWWVGTRILPEPTTESDIGEMLRVTGLSAAPGVLGVLGVVPGVGGLAMLASSLWQLATMVVAVRQALDFTSTGRAIGVCLVGFLVYLALLLVLVTLFAGGVAALGGGGGAGGGTVVP
jgi:hypothetical protein